MTDFSVVAGSDAAAKQPATPVSATVRRDHIGWGRAIVTAVLFGVIGFLTVVWLPDLVLKQLTSVGREARVLVAASVSLLMVVVLAWAMRRLQARGLL